MSNKSDRITIRVKPEDKEQIKMMAIKKNTSVSDMVLLALMKYVSEEEKKMMTPKE